MSKRAVIIGGGVIGVACAEVLRQAGLDVVLLERDRIGKGCSHANCGYVCPSHVLPLAGPGVVGKTLRRFFEKESALVIRPRLDPALWSWLVRFALRCTRLAMLEAGTAIQALLDSSRALYGEKFRTGELEADWQEKGLLFVFRTAKAMDHYAEVDHLLRDRFGMPARRYDSAALATLEPALKPGLAGAWHYPLDGHLRADRLMRSWHSRLERLGVEIREGCELLGFERAGGNRGPVRGVLTSKGTIPADQVVVATGAWTALLANHLGCTLPIQPGKGYSITMARPGLCPTIPLIFEEDSVAITPFSDGYRIGSTMEFAGFDATMNPNRLAMLRRVAASYLHEPEGKPVQEEWWGWRPMVPDGKPIIGRVPRMENVILATGHGMLGLSMATATAKLVGEIVTGKEPHVDPKPYAVNRF